MGTPRIIETVTLIGFSLTLVTGCAARFSFNETNTQNLLGNNGKNCQTVRKLGAWNEVDMDGIPNSDQFLGDLEIYTGSESAETNYQYSSWSAHPLVGPTPTGYQFSLFLYEGTDGLSLNMIMNVDEGGSPDNIATFDVDVRGNELRDSVVFSDDFAELGLVGSDATSETNSYKMNSHYWLNTDGGIIGPLEDNDFSIWLKNFNLGDITSTKIFNADGSEIVFSGTSLIIEYYSKEICI